MKVSSVFQKIDFLAILVVGLVFIITSNGQASLKVDLNKEFNFGEYSFNITGLFDDGSFDVSELNFRYHKNYNLLIGRHSIKFGPGYFSQLMLSDISSLNLLYYEGDFNLLVVPIHGQMLVALIDPSINKQFFAHRISNATIIPGLEVGFSESMVVHKKIHPAYYMPLPFWPYYLTSKLIGIYSEFNYFEDKYIGIDFSYKFTDSSKVYGELLVDEYPFVSYAKNPHKLAHLVGIHYPIANDRTVRVEYSNVFNYVYVHRFPENVYTNNGKPLGHWLGPDSEVIDIELEQAFGNDNIFTIGFRHIRRGIGSFDEDYGPDHLEKQFMSEVTKRELRTTVGYEKEVNESMVIKLSLELGRSFDLVSNTNLNILEFGLKLNLHI